MSNHDQRDRRQVPPAVGGGGRERSRDFHEAVGKFEQAVEDLVGSARGQLADRATAFIDDATEQLRRELGSANKASAASSRRASGAVPEAEGPLDAGYYDGHRPPRPDTSHQRARYLYRDTSRQRIVGVCAGIAAYYGVEPWVVRIIAVTGLLFFPGIVFPAYWIAYFILDKGPNGRERTYPGRRHDARGRGHHARMNRSSHAPEGAAGNERREEFRPPLTPRGTLRNLSADLAEAELRLRRMESHVTSGQYELQRELAKLDDGRPLDGSAGASTAARSA